MLKETNPEMQMCGEKRLCCFLWIFRKNAGKNVRTNLGCCQGYWGANCTFQNACKMCIVYVKPSSLARVLYTRLFTSDFLDYCVVYFDAPCDHSELEKPKTGFSILWGHWSTAGGHVWNGVGGAPCVVSPAEWHMGSEKSEWIPNSLSQPEKTSPSARPPLTRSSSLALRKSISRGGQLAGWPWTRICLHEGIWVYACVILRGQRSGYGAHKARLFPCQQEGRALSICCLHSI